MATLTALAQGLQTALTQSLFTTTTCFFSFSPKDSLKYPPSDQFAVIQPISLKVHDRSWGTTGTGKINLLLTWRASVWLFVRLGTDEAHRDDSYLTDQTNGCLVLTDSVIDLLKDYTLADGSNHFGYELDSVNWQKEDKGADGWAYTTLDYHTDLTGR